MLSSIEASRSMKSTCSTAPTPTMVAGWLTVAKPVFETTMS
jgi:hypothetical protein